MKIELIAITVNSEKIIEQAGRTCYLSWGKITDDSYIKFIRMLIKSGHHSVLEHSMATFLIKGSRAMTHQLVRHRLCSYSQKSQRYVDENKFEYIIPDSIARNKAAIKVFNSVMKQISETYNILRDLKIPKEDARFVLPNACESEIVVSANFREWRHIIEMRCDKHAQWEIRAMANEILKILYENAPVVFEDLKEKFK